MDSDDSQETSDSPPSCLVENGRVHGDRIIHVSPFASSIHMTSSSHATSQSNGDTTAPLKQHSHHNGSNNSLNVEGEDDACGIIHVSNSNRNYSTAYSQNGYLQKTISSPLYPLSEHASSVKYMSTVHNKSSHAMSRSVNSGHPVSSQTPNVASNSPQCVFMIQQNGSNELMAHPHANNGLPTSVVLATGMPLPISSVTPGVQQTSNAPAVSSSSINLPSLHQYALATSKRKTSQFSFMPIDPAILSSNHHHHHHHQASSQHNHQHSLSMHNSPQNQSKSSPSLQLLSSSSDFASINSACSAVTPSVIRGTIGASTSSHSHPLSLSPSIAGTSAPPAGMKNRDEKRRATHNEVERRRRDKINSWILKLSKLVPDCNSDQTKQGQVSTDG